jgi:hypothetical protein
MKIIFIALDRCPIAHLMAAIFLVTIFMICPTSWLFMRTVEVLVSTYLSVSASVKQQCVIM